MKLITNNCAKNWGDYIQLIRIILQSHYQNSFFALYTESDEI